MKIKKTTLEIIVSIFVSLAVCFCAWQYVERTAEKQSTKTVTNATVVAEHKAKSAKATKSNFNNIVLITDSYGDPAFTEGRYLAGELRNRGVNITQEATQAGAGFNTDYGTYAFKTQINKLVIDYGVKQVVVVSGYNDIWNASHDTIKNNAVEFINIAHEKFPNANVRFFFVGKNCYDRSPAYIANYEKATGAWRDACKDYDAELVAGAENILVGGQWFSGDYLHPNVNGIARLAKYMAPAIINNEAVGDTGEAYKLDPEPVLKVEDVRATELIEITPNAFNGFDDINVVVGEIIEEP